MGYIYILTNNAFKSDIVKIGYADNVEFRVKELNYSSSLPLPFHIYATYEVPVRLCDQKVHTIIDKLNPSLRLREKQENGKEHVREFFELSPEDAYGILEAMAEIHNCQDKLKKYEHNKPTTLKETCEPSNSAEDKPRNAAVNKRLPFRFSMCNIKVGDEIVFTKDSQISCHVVSDNSVEYKGKKYSLSGLAQKLTGSKSLAGTHYFTYNGEIIDDLRKRAEQQNESNKNTILNSDSRRRPNFSFAQFDIKIGESLIFTKDPSITCIVIDDKKVKYQGQIYSISGLATKLLGKTRSVNGLLYFSHNGNVLLDLWTEHCAKQQT